jgi:hypothetical protein
MGGLSIKHKKTDQLAKIMILAPSCGRIGQKFFNAAD